MQCASVTRISSVLLPAGCWPSHSGGSNISGFIADSNAMVFSHGLFQVLMKMSELCAHVPEEHISLQVQSQTTITYYSHIP